MKRARSVRIVAVGVALLVLAANARASEVAVELLEGPFKDKSWELADGKITERYTEPAFGFVTVPGKFSNRGLFLDRSNPYVVRATKSLAPQAGEYTLLVR